MLGHNVGASLYPSAIFERSGYSRVTVAVLLVFLICLPALCCAATANIPPVLTSPPAIPTEVQPVSPFTIVGFLQRATLNVGSDPAAGGTLTVNGHQIKVTTNTIVTMPGTFLKWEQLFTLAPQPWGPRQTGMALSDMPKPLTTYEVMVQGNRIMTATSDEYTAGLIWIWQQSLNSGQGFINYIDYKNGELHIGGVLNDPSTGSRVRLNDPKGRFGRALSPDMRFAIDEDNPTVRTATGYPMCIPRVDLNAASASSPVADDALCPQMNRPRDPRTGGLLSQFTMPPPPCSSLPAALLASVPAPICTNSPASGSPDATRQMPFEVGDYVTFQGSLVQDKSAPACSSTQEERGSLARPECEYMSAWSVIAGIGAFTAPGTMPAYVAVDVTQMGTGAILNSGLPQEATAGVRIEGFTTDPTEPIDIYGIDIDPCTGRGTDRYWGTQPVQQISQLGRFRFIPLGGTFTPAVREIRAVSQSLSQGAIPATIIASNTFANGLIAGQYDAPMSRYIFPETAEAGLTNMPLNFQDFPFLTNGFLASKCTVALSPLSLSFAGQLTGTTSAAQQVTLTNTGSGALDVSKITITQPFAQTNNCGGELVPGASCALNVTFAAGTTRIQTGMLQLSDTANTSPQRVSLLGTVMFPAAANIVPATLNFADQAPGTTSAPQVVTLSNTGGTDMKITSISITPGYSQTNHCGSVLKAGLTCTFNITFNPNALGAQSGKIVINDDAPGSPHVLALNGASSDFSLQPSARVATVAAGDSVTYTLHIAGTQLASGSVKFACDYGALVKDCSITPGTVKLNGKQVQNVMVFVTAAAGRQLKKRAGLSNSLPLALTLMIGLVTVFSGGKRTGVAPIAVIAIIAVSLSGCGGAVGSPVANGPTASAPGAGGTSGSGTGTGAGTTGGGIATLGPGAGSSGGTGVGTGAGTGVGGGTGTGGTGVGGGTSTGGGTTSTTPPAASEVRITATGSNGAVHTVTLHMRITNGPGQPRQPNTL